MYSQMSYSRNSPKPKTPKSGDGSNIFRMPSPLSPTFITTQSLIRMPVQRKKERVSSSPGINVNKRENQHPNMLSTHMVTDGKIKYLPVTSANSYNGYSAAQLQSNSNAIPSKEEQESNMNKAYDMRQDKTRNEVQRVSRAQVYLPGDHVIFAESPSAPGIPIVYRLEEERRSNPDKLNLDRRKLSVCPILEGEEHLRLLNYQHNYIKKIEHLEMLRKLIFLDLYDNQIEEMSGLSSLKLLRVLMLGKNRVTKISNLQELIMLDVLDLHGNSITKIENVDHLKHLRVLNLAGNHLTVVDNLTGLASLSELNLRRNSIHTVHDIDQLSCLQRLFLSFNNIKHFNDIVCLSKSTSLIELSLDGNPFAKCSDYKQLIIQNVSNLRQIDMKRLTDEEKRFAYIAAKREEDKQKENERLSTIKEKRHIAISNAQRQWSQQLKSTADESPHLPSLSVESSENLEKRAQMRISPRECFDIEQCTLKVVDRVKSLSASHLAELDNNSLNLYGSGSLEALDKDWGEKTLSSINIINFKYINFHDIIPHLYKLCRTFQSLKSLNFDMTNISSLNELNMFSLLPRLDNLHIVPDGNPVTKLSLWKPYIIYRLSHAQLKTLNDVEITHTDILHASNMFEPVQVITSKLSKYRIKMLQANYRNLGAEDVSTNSLWLDRECTDVQKAEMNERKQFSSSYVNEMIQNGILGDRKIKLLDECWDKFLFDIMSTYLNEMDDLDTYCEVSLEKIRKSIKSAT